MILMTEHFLIKHFKNELSSLKIICKYVYIYNLKLSVSVNSFWIINPQQ